MHPAVLPIGILLIVAAALLFAAKRTRFARYRRVEGTVIELIERPGHTDDRQNVTFTPRIAFRTQGGADVEFQPAGAFFTRVAVGDRVPLLHDPHEPSRVVVDNAFHRHLTEIVLACFGFAATIPALVHRFG